MTTTDATAGAALTTTLGGLLFLARRDAGLSQTKLGNWVREKQSTISSWESGKSRPSLAQVVKLSDALGIDGSALLHAVASDIAAARIVSAE